ncbi:MAG: hypothetical protein IT429_18350 [Gemmataceae bacterium]|nr:hypothetical protein [Gemmataceae bacterium]
MGAWGSAPWANDLAADWFDELFGTTRLAQRVEKALNYRDLEEYAPEIRAAAYILVALGRNYIWPVDDLDRHLKLAISKLEAIRELPDYEGMPEIDEEIAILRSRLNEPNALDAAAEAARAREAAEKASREKQPKKAGKKPKGGAGKSKKGPS